MKDTNPLSVEERLSSLEKKLKDIEQNHTLEKTEKLNQIVIIIFSQDLDKVLSAFIIASAACALGIKVKMVFTFWGINAIKNKRIFSQKKISEKLMSWMSAKSFKNLPISNLNMLGIGPKFLKHMMKSHKMVSMEDLMNICIEEGVEFLACEMTMNMMGIQKEELLEGIEYTGVTKIITEAMRSNFTLYI